MCALSRCLGCAFVAAPAILIRQHGFCRMRTRCKLRLLPLECCCRLICILWGATSLRTFSRHAVAHVRQTAAAKLSLLRSVRCWKHMGITSSESKIPVIAAAGILSWCAHTASHFNSMFLLTPQAVTHRSASSSCVSSDTSLRTRSSVRGILWMCEASSTTVSQRTTSSAVGTLSKRTGRRAAISRCCRPSRCGWRDMFPQTEPFVIDFLYSLVAHKFLL